MSRCEGSFIECESVGAGADRHRAYLARRYIPELDGLRAISALLVVSVHMGDGVWGWLNGAEGVTVFFVLSGYLITRLALIEERTRGCLNKTAFFIRRTSRLFPLYYFVLAVNCLLIFGLGIEAGKRRILASGLPYYLTYMQDVFSSLVNQLAWTSPYTQTWTLGVEEKFYLLWPFVGFVVWRRSPNLRLTGTVLLMIVAGSAFAWAGPSFGSLIHPYSQILIGCLVALALDDPRWFAKAEWLGRARVGRAVLAVFLTIHFAMPHVDFGPYGLPRALYAAASAGLLVALLLGTGPIQQFLSRPSLILIGRLSYGIYLVHLLARDVAEQIAPPGTNNPLVSATALLLAWAISVGAAWVLYYAIEIHGIRLGRRWSAALLSADRSRPRAEPSSVARLVLPHASD